MENNQNNRTSQTQAQAKTNTTPQSNIQGSASSSSPSSSSSSQSRNLNSNLSNSSSQSRNSSSNLSASSSSSSMQGRSSQQATTGQGGMKNIQDKLQQFGNTAVSKVNSLSTTQKVIGGSLLALGAGWLALGSKNKATIKNKVSSLGSGKQAKKNNGGSPNISAR